MGITSNSHNITALLQSSPLSYEFSESDYAKLEKKYLKK